jgi:uncharacterized membrane protein
LVGFLFELISFISKKPFFPQASFSLLMLAAASAIFAFLTGDAAGEGMEGGRLETAMEAHEQAAAITLWLTIAAAAVKLAMVIIKREIKWLKIAAFILFSGAVAGVARTGYLGGQLVYKHAAGVELSFGILDKAKSENVSNEKHESESKEKSEDESKE